MTERRYFITVCPTCKGSKWFISKPGYWPDGNGSSTMQTYVNPEIAPCPSCAGQGKVIAQVLAPFIPEESR